MRSIRQRLLSWQVGALIVAAILEGLLTHHLAWGAFNDVRDNSLQLIAHSVVRHGVPPADDPGAAADALATSQPISSDLGHFTTQIWSPDGRLLYSSLAGGGPALQPPGLHVVPWGGEEWRVYTLADPRQTVQVAVTSADRLARFAEFVPWLLAPLALLVAVMWLLMPTAVNSALAPLDAWGRDLRRRDVQHLHPVATQALPDELVPLGDALNSLLARVDTLLNDQRALLADVAHELNTPLAAIKLQAQLARRSAETEAQRRAAFDELDRGIARATHLVAQLLQIARLEPGVREHRTEPLRLDRLAAEAVGGFSARADEREVDLGLSPSEPLDVMGDPHDLRVLVDNLIDNALRHTPRGSRVDVEVRARDGWAWLAVSDNGPGIAAPDRERALQRFARLRPEQTTGSGLGLAIVQQIVQRHGGQLQLDGAEGGGLRVRVGLPLRG
ncbi:sensor histidine kinase [Hydrogenophaga sp. T2]|uniref:sensor histidine kinase n=1 Tax=Hydrogenophaga sp. T2 TaxID=3132823 RepID=UPI003CEB971D